MNVLQFPLVRVTVFFVSGILFAQSTKPHFHWVITSLFISVLFLLGSYLLHKNPFLKPWHFGLHTAIVSFLVGVLTCMCSFNPRNPNHYLHQLKKKDGTHELTVELTEKLKTTAFSERYVCKVKTFDNQKSSGKILLNIKRTDVAFALPIGSLLWVKGSLRENSKPKNPDQFDYGRYLENQQIYVQLYASYSEIKTAATPKKTLSYYADRLRHKMIQNLEKNHFGQKELPVLSALILGQQQDISAETLREYQYAGAIHILSVSGLHIGLVLLFVTFLLKPIPNTRKAAFIKLILVLLSLWGFGILAGLAPSVVRSATMFSFVAIGLYLRRSVNIYHTLVVSVLLILLVRPSFLFDVGFQLSYAALFFIVWLQPFLAGLWQPKNKIMKYFWDILTVSFAAQIGTFPLSIYYFHQFPGLFFLTNLAVLPLLGIIMALGVLVLFLAAFDVVWMPLLKVLEWGIWFLNQIISKVAAVESFVWKDIPLNSLLLFGWYAVVLTLFIWLMKPSPKKAIIGLTSVFLLQTAYFFTFSNNQRQKELIVFHQKKNTLITVRNGEKVIAYTNGKSKSDRAVNPYLTANFCRMQKTVKLPRLYYFKGKRILVLDSLMAYKGIGKPDVLLLTQSAKVNLERLFEGWKPKVVVADGSNFRSYVKRWKSTCRKEKIPFHDTGEKGFYKLY